MSAYVDFLERKSQLGEESGFAPSSLPDFLFDFQGVQADWALRKGRGAVLDDAGMGKTAIELAWSDAVVRRTNKPVLIATPLAVSAQTVREGEKFGIECHRSRDGQFNGARIVVTNYEQLHKFDRHKFAGVVCDESAAIKDFEGERQKLVTDFMRETPFRLLATATAAPNDYIELLTSAEALGEMGRMDAISMFFKNDENSNHPIWWGARWRFKAHAEMKFWQWVCWWARTARKPSDVDPRFSDEQFKLPPMEMRETVVKNVERMDGYLFVKPAETLHEQREERRLTLDARCEAVAEKVTGTGDCSVSWCHLNDEGDLLEKIIPGARQVHGRQSDEEKEELLSAFSSGQLKNLVIKPKIGAWGLNWQHCNHMTTFPSHSFEQFYQSIRRLWRFGQKRNVTVDIVTSEGELGVLKNMQRKQEAADKMFSMIVGEMNNALKIERAEQRPNSVEVPEWA